MKNTSDGDISIENMEKMDGKSNQEMKHSVTVQKMSDVGDFLKNKEFIRNPEFTDSEQKEYDHVSFGNPFRRSKKGQSSNDEDIDNISSLFRGRSQSKDKQDHGSKKQYSSDDYINEARGNQ
jgi:hypothetical protein